ncbi:MAG: hypothetical protein JST80_03850 [Bdellovibrionales bacterium]|nr:hypothetical protein [Bdellovibrionales bacterium]
MRNFAQVCSLFVLLFPVQAKAVDQVAQEYRCANRLIEATLSRPLGLMKDQQGFIHFKSSNLGPEQQYVFDERIPYLVQPRKNLVKLKTYGVFADDKTYKKRGTRVQGSGWDAISLVEFPYGYGNAPEALDERFQVGFAELVDVAFKNAIQEEAAANATGRNIAALKSYVPKSDAYGKLATIASDVNTTFTALQSATPKFGKQYDDAVHAHQALRKKIDAAVNADPHLRFDIGQGLTWTPKDGTTGVPVADLDRHLKSYRAQARALDACRKFLSPEILKAADEFVAKIQHELKPAQAKIETTTQQKFGK